MWLAFPHTIAGVQRCGWLSGEPCAPHSCLSLRCLSSKPKLPPPKEIGSPRAALQPGACLGQPLALGATLSLCPLQPHPHPVSSRLAPWFVLWPWLGGAALEHERSGDSGKR